MNTRTTFVFCFITLAGCSSASKMKLPSGKEGFFIKCPRSIQNCYEKANETCVNGYNIVDKTDNSSIMKIGNDLTHVKKFEMLIECK